MVMNRAIQTNAIVSSLFPANVRDRLMKQVTASATSKASSGNFMAPSRRLKGYLAGDGEESSEEDEDSPIADLFPHCTVMFSDIAGENRFVLVAVYIACCYVHTHIAGFPCFRLYCVE